VTKEQKWLNTITDFASSTLWMLDKYGGYCENPYVFDRHHITGRKAKRKINYVSVVVGEWYVIPVPFEMHDVHQTKHKLNVTHCKNAFEAVIGTQKELFTDMVNSMRDLGYTIPFDDEVIEAL